MARPDDAPEWHLWLGMFLALVMVCAGCAELWIAVFGHGQ